jgi:hypothetical protein
MARGGLDGPTLHDLRRIQLEHMPDVVTICYMTPVADGQGGYTASACTTGSYMGRVHIPSGRRVSETGRMIEQGEGVLTLPYDALVSASDIACCDSIAYRVTYVDEGKSWDTALRCGIQRVR